MSLQQLFDVNGYFDFFRAVSGSDRKGKGIIKKRFTNRCVLYESCPKQSS